MSKSIYIPKGQDCHMLYLTCDNLVVDGNLRVDGEIRVKHVRGSGFIYASAVFAKTITFNTIDAGMIATDKLIASHVTAVDIHAEREMSVSLFTKAINVKAGVIMLSEAEIESLDAKVYLPPKRRGQTMRRFVSCLQAKRIARLCLLSQKYMIPESDVDTAATESVGTDDTAVKTEADSLLNDAEFLRLRAMYRLTQLTGDIWQLVPKQEPTSRAVILSKRFNTPFDEAA